MRTERHDIEAVWTKKLIHALYPDQYFCVTPKAYEIWQKEPLARVKRIPRSSVLLVETGEEITK